MTLVVLLLGFIAGAATVVLGNAAARRARLRTTEDAWLGFLRHPLHPARCACGLYGQPEDGMLTIRDNTGYHNLYRCEPAREHIERED